jgi:hypothetical protein
MVSGQNGSCGAVKGTSERPLPLAGVRPSWCWRCHAASGCCCSCSHCSARCTSCALHASLLADSPPAAPKTNSAGAAPASPVGRARPLLSPSQLSAPAAAELPALWRDDLSGSSCIVGHVELEGTSERPCRWRGGPPQPQTATAPPCRALQTARGLAAASEPRSRRITPAASEARRAGQRAPTGGSAHRHPRGCRSRHAAMATWR